MEFSIDNAIIAATISAAISLAVFFYRERKVEPQKWKRDAKAQTLLKQIEAYGELLNFLNSAEARRRACERLITQVKETDTHLFVLPGHEIQFNQIFRKNMGFYSEEVIRLHTSFIEHDTDYDFAEKRWKENQSSWYQGVNLSELHKVVRRNFDELRKQYEDMTSYNFG